MNSKIIYISPVVLLELIRSPVGARAVTPLPTDLKVHRVFVDDTRRFQRIGLVVESAEFGDDAHDTLLDELRPLFEKL